MFSRYAIMNKMKNRLFIFTCITKNSKDLFTTSSEKYEYSLIKELEKSFDVTVISQGGELFPNCVTVSKIKRNRKLNKELTAKIDIKSTDTFLFYGYDFFQISQLLKLKKKYKCNIISFIFDHHNPSIENKRFAYKKLIDFYYKLGTRKINKLDGILLFNEKAINFLKIKVPTFVSKPFVFKEDKLFENSIPSGKTFLFSGTLSKYNAVEEMLMFFEQNPDYSLNICGGGPLKNKVIEVSNRCKNIHYFGVINQNELDKLIEKTDFVFCLRTYDKYVSSLSYPSKTVEALKYRKPLIVNDYFSDSSNIPYIWKAESFSNEDIDSVIKQAASYDYSNSQEKLNDLYDYYLDMFSSDKAIDGIKEFINNIAKK